jgi:hypothetical protein
VSPLAEPGLFVVGVATGVFVGGALAVYALIRAIGKRERARRDHRYARGER